MNKLFVSYEIAKLLKEKGFDEFCFKGYFNYTNTRDASGDIIELLSPKIRIVGEDYLFKNSIDFDLNENPNAITNKNCAAPLKQQVVEWFKEKYNLHIVTLPKVMYPDDMVGTEYYYEIYHNDKHFTPDGVYDIDSVLEVAIQSALAIINNDEGNIPIEEKEKQITPEESIINIWFSCLSKETKEKHLSMSGYNKNWPELNITQKRNIYYALI